MQRILFILVLIAVSVRIEAVTFNTVRLSESQIQHAVSAMMPLEREKFFVKTVFTEPVVRLISEGNKVSVRVNIQVIAMKTMRGSGFVEVTGGLDYRPEEGAFYLKNPVISSMHVNRLSGKFQPQAKKLAQSALVGTLSSRPVYRLNDNDIRQKLAKSTLKSVRVENKALVAEFGLF